MWWQCLEENTFPSKQSEYWPDVCRALRFRKIPESTFGTFHSDHPSIHPNLRQCTAILSAKCWFFIWRISLNNAVAFLLMSRPHWVEKIKTWANCEQDKLDIFYHLEYGKGDDLKTITLYTEASHWHYVVVCYWKSLFQRKATTPGNVSHQPTWVEKIMNTWFLWKSQPKFLLKVPHQDSLRS